MDQELMKDILAVMAESVDRIHNANDDPTIRDQLLHLIEEEPDTVLETIDGNFEFAELANAVIETVQCTNHKIQPALGRLEMVGEQALLDSILNAAENTSVDEQMKNTLYDMALSKITSLVQCACTTLEGMKDSRNTEVLWFENSRVLLGAQALVHLGKIPAIRWTQVRNEIMAHASKMVKSQDASVRKSVSKFFQIVGSK
jgi:hypothetical protein